MDVELFRQIRRQVEKLPSGQGRRYPWELRARIVEVVRRYQHEGYAADELAAKLAVPPLTLRRWLKGASVAAAHDALIPVEVIDPNAVRTFRVTTPSGFVVDGLELDDVLALLVAVA
jgi:transposase-like protein